MSDLRCLSCQATTTNGLALCELCQRYARTCLGVLPVYFRNLARWRPGRAGSRPVPGSRPPQGAFGVVAVDGISRALDEAGTDLTGWARSLSDDRGVDLPAGDDESGTVAAVCVMLAEHLTSIGTLEWAGEFVRKVAEHEAALRRLTETVVPGWYAGGCKRCGLATYVVPGLTWVTCGGCGATTYARDHLEAVRNEARDWVAPPMRIAEAVVALVDSEQSITRLHKRISKWGERGPENGGIEAQRRVDRDGDPVGPKRYRFGDVLDLLLTEGTTRVRLEESA